jgi:tight adherence protein C
LNYSSSLGQAIASLPEGPVREEFAKLLREIRAGKSRRQALLDLGERMSIASVHNFVAAMNQAEETGGEIVDVLTQQAHQRRNERFNKAEEIANKAPVRMLLPMMAFLFPILFMLIAFIIVVKLGEMGMLSDGMLRLLMT